MWLVVVFAGLAPLKAYPPSAEQRDLVPHVEFLYVIGGQRVGANSNGAGARIMQADPALGPGDSHSLAEIAVASDFGNVVEIGWNVDLALNGDVEPHLFTFHWIYHHQTCYNAGCGWVQVSTTHRPGMRVVPGELHDYAIKNVNGDWWLFYDGEGIGFYPAAEWQGAFTASASVEWYSEIAATNRMPCTQMGNGKFAADPGAATFDMMRLFDATGAAVPADIGTPSSDNDLLWSFANVTPTSFAFGGPGATSGCCTPASCVDVTAECGDVADPKCGGSLACGSCEDGPACSTEHRCPDGVGPRDYAGAIDITAVNPIPDFTPAASNGGCCDGGGGGATSATAGLVIALARRRRPSISR